MGKSYYQLLFGVYGAALLVGGASRIMLKLRFIDVHTGFYTRNTGIITVFNISLLLAAVLLFGASRLRRTAGEFPVARRQRIAGVFAVLVGVSILLFTFLGQPYPVMEQGYSDTILQVRDTLRTVLGALAGGAMIWVGALTAADKENPPAAAAALFGCVWQLYLLVSRFNSYTVLTTISDNLLAVLFMLFASLYLIGYARTVFGLARKDGRNYVIPAGLCASLTGLFLVVPNYLYVALNGGGIPAPLLDPWESVYTLLLSLHALVFVAGTVRSIQQV